MLACMEHPSACSGVKAAAMRPLRASGLDPFRALRGFELQATGRRTAVFGSEQRTACQHVGMESCMHDLTFA
jgi:hypothetical protein